VRLCLYPFDCRSDDTDVLNIRKVPDSNLGPVIGYSERDFCRDLQNETHEHTSWGTYWVTESSVMSYNEIWFCYRILKAWSDSYRHVVINSDIPAGHFSCFQWRYMIPVENSRFVAARAENMSQDIQKKLKRRSSRTGNENKKFCTSF